MKPLNILTVVGARPQFIKAAPLTSALSSAGHKEYFLHTGQHYDAEMSETFFKELNLPAPDANLGIGSGSHCQQTGQMLIDIGHYITNQNPDCVIVYGDTNSTLAAAMAAAKLNVSVVHVEAGLRSFNKKMPEEINRILTDHVSRFLFCPSQVAVNNLKREGIFKNVYLVGDVMYDSLMQNIELAERHSKIIEKLKLKPNCYSLATVHRAENTDDPKRLKSIFSAFEILAKDGIKIIIPLHPRTRKAIKSFNISLKNLHIIDPVPYLDMLNLEKNANIILSDSGGVQKEAYWFGIPAITLRNETEWVETVESGWNKAVGYDTLRIVSTFKSIQPGQRVSHKLNDGLTSERIVKILSNKINF
jgi:UDP-N-acetylglucosamine 2-epimerase